MTRVAVITGGSRGIGRAIATRLAQDGFDVGFCFLGNEAAAAETAVLVEEHGRRCVSATVDVADPAAVRAFVDDVRGRLGPIDVAVANAGITRDRSLAMMDPADWQAVLRTNLDGAFALLRSTTYEMCRRRAGSVVAVSSVVGLGGQAGQSNYAASKAGLHALVRSLAMEVGRFGVRANVVAPGYVQTDMVSALRPAAREKACRAAPLGRFGTPDEVADAVSFLVSDRATYITGTVLRVDGGISL